MIVPDVNLLLCAVIRGFEQHDAARQWLETLLNGSTEIGLAAPAVFGFPTGVQLAALAIEYQAELHSNDTDFGRASRVCAGLTHCERGRRRRAPVYGASRRCWSRSAIPRRDGSRARC